MKKSRIYHIALKLSEIILALCFVTGVLNFLRDNFGYTHSLTVGFFWHVTLSVIIFVKVYKKDR